MPKAIIYIGLVLIIIAMIPPALIARSRAVPSEKTRIHIIQDMDVQAKFTAQGVNPLFADNRAMRPPVPGTVARGGLDDDSHYNRGVVTSETGEVQWADTLPSQVPLTMALLDRGQERYNIFCTPCHGESGYGDGMIHVRAMELVTAGSLGGGTTWVQPRSVHDPEVRDQPVGQLFNTVTHGIRQMAGYESQIPVDDRWAIVAYVKALQRSQHARIEDVPAELRNSLEVTQQ